MNIEKQKEILQKFILFIDDIPNNLGDYNNKQIVCNEYKYYDLQEILLQKYNIDIVKNEKILNLFQLYNIDYYNISSPNFEYNDLYLYNLKKLMIQRRNLIYKNDVFFLRLQEIIIKHSMI